VARKSVAPRRVPERDAAARLRPRRAHAAAVVMAVAVAGIGVIGMAGCSTAPSSSAPASSGSSSPSATALPSAPAAGQQSLSETGSTLLYPLFRTWAQAYQGQFPDVKITTAGTGSTKGISSAAEGKVDIGGSDAYLSSATVAEYPTLENIPLAISAQLVSYNLPGVSGNLKLNSTVLAEIYQGYITMWDDPAIRALNPGVSLPAIQIRPLHRSDGSGDTFLFTSYLAKQGSSWAGAVGYGTTVAWPSVPGALHETGNSGMVAGCKAHPGCLAYIGISYLSQASAAGLGEAALLNSSGNYELPNATSMSAEAAGFAVSTPATGTISLIDGLSPAGYPIVNYEYAIVSTQQSSAAKATTIKALLHWILTTGSSATYLSTVDFQALPVQVATIADALIARIG
jgi:phosphate transport system substrate-binding protein